MMAQGVDENDFFLAESAVTRTWQRQYRHRYLRGKVFSPRRRLRCMVWSQYMMCAGETWKTPAPSKARLLAQHPVPPKSVGDGQSSQAASKTNRPTNQPTTQPTSQQTNQSINQLQPISLVQVSLELPVPVVLHMYCDLN